MVVVHAPNMLNRRRRRARVVESSETMSISRRVALIIIITIIISLVNRAAGILPPIKSTDERRNGSLTMRSDITQVMDWREADSKCTFLMFLHGSVCRLVVSFGRFGNRRTKNFRNFFWL